MNIDVSSSISVSLFRESFQHKESVYTDSKIQNKEPSQITNHSSHNDRVTISSDKPSKQGDTDELTDDEKKEVQKLKDRDREVRIHEQAHAAVGGQYAGSPSYEYKTGPDGKKYAVGGEVSIDVSEEEKPKDTIQKMQVVRAAALAPAEPSAQDLKVAAEASQKESSARAELSKTSLQGESIDEQSDSSSNSKSLVTSQILQYEKAASPARNGLSVLV